MRKARPHKSRDGKAVGDNRDMIALTAVPALPTKKPPAPSVKRRLRRRELLK
jgi:hypothetical protein